MHRYTMAIVVWAYILVGKYSNFIASSKDSGHTLHRQKFTEYYNLFQLAQKYVIR